MARITLIPVDGVCGVNGVFRNINFAGIDPTIHAVQWKDTKGRIEYNDGKEQKVIDDISPYQVFLDRWTGAAPIPGTAEDADSLYTRSLTNDRLFKALLISLNNGDFVPGRNLSGAAVKTIIKSNM